MTSKAALLTLLTLWGVGAAVPHQAWADETSSEQATDTKDEPGDLTNRVWVKAGDDAALPGVIKIFLSDGTLVQDSCWETHRLSPWQMTDAKSLTWNEDGMDIKADIVTLTADELVLSLKLKGGDVEEHYTPAPVPSVCPDMPKG
ncbi:MAG: hypothetical protein BGO82_16245 [Devosia sp. 67-54]|uniref:hypothetical protein n=1 Tax=unclassified Devosia TaxID=196773 RepID=UPI00096240EA|nr:MULTISPECIES: hypothetical protein [unclassified Devosia]MBN9303925.1 hypothetical protein [Devosia sp.]OJX17772.1 MAG: hypothetical protein BGO82_16245 [Devosia sp. 67-54]